MILQNKDIQKNLFICNELSKILKDKVLIKNNIVYKMKKEILEFKGKKKCVLDNLSDYVYYLINNSKKICFTDEINLDTILWKRKIDFNALDEFRFEEKGFFPKGNVNVFYFSSKFVNNPLNIISQIISSITLNGEYHDIKIDYILYNQKIVYYILFRYSLGVDRNFKDMLKAKNDILNLKRFDLNKVVFPEVQLKFQEEQLKEFQDINSIKENLVYEGNSLFTPSYKLKEINFENI